MDPGRRRSHRAGWPVLLAALWCLVGRSASPGAPLRGDLDRNGAVSVTDAIGLLEFLFRAGPEPYCGPVADANGDGEIDVSDPVTILLALFVTAAPLPALDAGSCPPCSQTVEPNGAPSLPARPIYRTHPGQVVGLVLGAEDPDGDPLLYEGVELPAGASVEGESGILRWEPAADQVGSYRMTIAVTDAGCPPNRVEGRVLVHVLALDSCSRPTCDPAEGCEQGLPPLAETCCGGEGARLPEPDFLPDPGCPEGEVLHVGRNPRGAPTIGRLANCDLLSLTPLGQGGHILRFNIEARCLAPGPAEIDARLETADVVLVDQPFDRDLETRADGFLEARKIETIAEGPFGEGEEAHLTVVVTDGDGTVLRRTLRLALTRDDLEDLP